MRPIDELDNGFFARRATRVHDEQRKLAESCGSEHPELPASRKK